MRVVMVAAITSKIKKSFQATVILPAGNPLRLESQILAFQVVSVAKERLGECLGHLDDDQLRALENAMRLVWGL
jgi:mRNA-degrading endonuclease toxin of MazEF toxin-antitoxin module